MDVPRRTSSGRVMRFHHTDHAAGIATMDTNVHWDAEDIHGFTAVVIYLDGTHKHKLYWRFRFTAPA